VLAGIEQDGRGERQRRRGPAKLELESVLARGLDEDSREELGAGLHPEPLLCLLALAGEADNAGRGVDEAADKKALRRGLAGRVLADLTVQFVGANHVTALSVHAIKIGHSILSNEVILLIRFIIKDQCLHSFLHNFVSSLNGIFFIAIFPQFSAFEKVA